MATIGEHISNIRVRLGNAGFDDDGLSDQFLYSQLNLASAIIVSRVTNSHKKLSDWCWTTYPVPLVEVNKDLYSCETIPERCRVLESTFEIPKALTARNKMLFKVYTNSEMLSEGNPSILQFDPIKAGKASWEIFNGKLRIYNNRVLRAIEVKGVWADPIAWKTKNYCGTELDECLDFNSEYYPLTVEEYQQMAYDIVLQGLGIPLQQETKNNPH